MKHLFTKRGYIFTDKKNPKQGVMAFILGVIATVSIFLALHLTYRNNGQAAMQYGAAVLLAVIYAIVGIILGVRSLREKDIFRIFPIFGLLLNIIAVIAGGVILYFGGI
jgi:heme/copper-type cytochrome/quinol oxidase subunit 4